jgi:Fe-S-cluster containining protein
MFRTMYITDKEKSYFKEKDRKDIEPRMRMSRRRGFEVIATEHGNNYFFQKGCEHLQEDNKCKNYETRPEVCKTYKCGVLSRYQEEKISHKTALNIIAKAKEILNKPTNREIVRDIMHMTSQKL